MWTRGTTFHMFRLLILRWTPGLPCPCIPTWTACYPLCFRCFPPSLEIILRWMKIRVIPPSLPQPRGKIMALWAQNLIFQTYLPLCPPLIIPRPLHHSLLSITSSSLWMLLQASAPRYPKLLITQTFSISLLSAVR